MNNNGFEIERKFLIAMPEEDFLAGCEISGIKQTYLLGEPGTTERVRRRRWADHCEYTHTVKRRISNIRREEDEREISEAEYLALLERADPARHTIEKLRCCYTIGGEIWEIDVFPFWEDRAIVEIELEDEGQEVMLPPGLRLIREVTDDPRYTNSALSLAIPNDEI